MTTAEIIGIAASGVAAGMINAIAGGGTLITFPVLILSGSPPIVANATSTLALVFGTAGSVYGYRGQLAAIRPWLRRFIPVSVVGGLVGGFLLTHFSESVFNRLAPFLILFATLLFLGQSVVRRLMVPAGVETKPSESIAAGLIFQFFVAVYGGYFGAGIGILMLASMGLMGLSDIHQMNAIKTVLGSTINLVAAAYFVWAGLVDWPKAAVLTIGALSGYFVGAHCSQRIPQNRVRQLITAIGLGISMVMFYRQFK